MRTNIEELAADEEARLGEENWERTQGILLLLGSVLAVGGWWRFRDGFLGSGSSLVLLSLFCFVLRWGVHKAIRLHIGAVITGALASLSLFMLYVWSALPSFYWGMDPAFWLAVHAGAVIEPVWSPLSYLVGQTACFLFPNNGFTLLPILSAFILSTAVFVLAQELIGQFRKKSQLDLVFVFLVCSVVGLSRPFWTAGTMASGLVSGLGLLLFLFQRHVLQLGKDHAELSFFLTGALFSVHPLWGMAGFGALMAVPEVREDIRARWFSFLLGLSPYLWIVFRAGKFFPSWGGSRPFAQAVSQTISLVLEHFRQDWFWKTALGTSGWVLVVFLVLAGFLGTVNLVLGVEVSRKLITRADLWIWFFCGLAGIAFYSNGTDLLGPTFLWFVTGTAGFFSFSFDRRSGFSEGIFSKMGLGLLALFFLVAAGGVAWLPGQNQVRNQCFFPQQHALNLIRPLGPKDLLVCDDPFEYYGTQEARWMEPSSQAAPVVYSGDLARQWYLAQWIAQEPQVLFSGFTGGRELLVKSLILDNWDRWKIHWSRSGLPEGWHEPKPMPTGLTELFYDGAELVDPAGFQYHYDLDLVPAARSDLDDRSKFYLSRYVDGFKGLGESLLNNNRYTDAIHAYDRAARLDPSDKAAMEALAQIYAQHNLLEAAQLEYEKIVQEHPVAITRVLKALKTAQAANDATQAADYLGQWVKLNADLADAQYQLSKIYEHQGREQEAKALLEASVQVDPQQVEAQLTLGHSMEKTQDWSKAEEAFRSVLLVDPQNKEAQVELWKLLNKSKR